MNGFLALSAGHCLILVNVESNFPGSQISREVEIPGKLNFEIPGKTNFPGTQISREVKFPGKSNFPGSQILNFPGSQISQKVEFPGKSNFQEVKF